MVTISLLYAIGLEVSGPYPQVAGVATESQQVQDFPTAPDMPPILGPRPKTSEFFPELKLSARAVLVKDPAAPTPLYEENATSTVPIASLTKLMTAIVAAQRLPLEKLVEIKAVDTEVPPARANFLPGEQVAVVDLLRAMLISSANDAALALARAAGPDIEQFVAAMNQEASALGMEDTNFINPVGFDHESHYSTARDLGKLVEEFINYPMLTEIVRQKNAVIASADKRFKHRVTSTNKLLVHEEVLGLKTGYTKEALGNLIIYVDLPEMEEANRYYGIILGSSQRERDGERLMAWVKNNFEWTN